MRRNWIMGLSSDIDEMDWRIPYRPTINRISQSVPGTTGHYPDLEVHRIQSDACLLVGLAYGIMDSATSILIYLRRPFTVIAAGNGEHL